MITNTKHIPNRSNMKNTFVKNFVPFQQIPSEKPLTKFFLKHFRMQFINQCFPWKQSQNDSAITSKRIDKKVFKNGQTVSAVFAGSPPHILDH